jgi:hypothetical protein
MIADEWLGKPVGIKQLYEAVGRWTARPSGTSAL